MVSVHKFNLSYLVYMDFFFLIGAYLCSSAICLKINWGWTSVRVELAKGFIFIYNLRKCENYAVTCGVDIHINGTEWRVHKETHSYTINQFKQRWQDDSLDFFFFSSWIAGKIIQPIFVLFCFVKVKLIKQIKRTSAYTA